MTNTTKMEAVVFEAAVAVDDPQQCRAIIDAACRNQRGEERLDISKIGVAVGPLERI